jgi:predicted ferric reductase
VLAGLVLKSRPTRRLRPASVTEVHKTLAVTGLGALALHGTALVLDSTVKVTPAALLVPGLVSYRPLPVALGVVGGWLFGLVTVSFWLRKRIGVKAWRRLHWFTYALFLLATLHGVLAGTDTTRAWTRDLYLGALGAVVAATAWRVLVPPPRRAPREAKA